jgi:hypothetical protein
VQDVSHQHDVGLGQVALEKAARLERQPVCDAGILDVLLENRRDFGQIESGPTHVLIGQDDLRRQIALRRATSTKVR